MGRRFEPFSSAYESLITFSSTRLSQLSATRIRIRVTSAVTIAPRCSSIPYRSRTWREIEACSATEGPTILTMPK